MLAFLDYEQLQCAGCGGYLPETTDEANSYEATPPGRCYRCEALHSNQRDYKDQKNPEDLVLWPMKQKLKKTE